MTQKLVVVEDGEGGYQLLRESGSELPRVHDDVSGEGECCCNCDLFPYCLYCTDTQAYTSTQTVDWPDDSTVATLRLIGAGGEGGDTSTAGQSAGGGGGGGSSYSYALVKSAASLDLVINDAANSYASEVKQGGSTVSIAYAGSDGGDGSNGAGGTGGSGDAFTGGDGADGVDGSAAGGGGGGAGTKQNGTNASGATGGTGGIRYGGKGGDAPGTGGADYGGGGAGGKDGSAGGDRGSGLVRISWWLPPKLQVTIQGLPSDHQHCDCEPDVVNNAVDHDFNWAAVNGTYLLQGQIQSANFEWVAPGTDPSDCETMTMTNGILIEHILVEDCVTGEMAESETYVTKIGASLSCGSEGMHVDIGNFVVDGRQRLYDPIDGWEDWRCTGDSKRFVCNSFYNKHAVPCTRQEMTTDVQWQDAVWTPPGPDNTTCFFTLGLTGECGAYVEGQVSAVLLCDT